MKSSKYTMFWKMYILLPKIREFKNFKTRKLELKVIAIYSWIPFVLTSCCDYVVYCLRPDLVWSRDVDASV